MDKKKINMIISDIVGKTRDSYLAIMDPYTENIDKEQFLSIIFFSLAKFTEHMIRIYSDNIPVDKMELFKSIFNEIEIELEK